jgi:hypothetical protein
VAVVFISPKHKQKTFLLGITATLGVFLVVVTLWVFLAQPSVPEGQLVFNKPKVSLNLNFLSSDQFASLEHFKRIPLQFSYTAVDQNQRNVKGFISAESEDDARKVLLEGGLSVTQIKQVNVGRLNPFIPY